MGVCERFDSSVECALTLQNELNIKLLIIGLITIYAVVAIYYHRQVNPDKSYYNLFLNYILKILPPIYLASLPLYLLTLVYSVSLELFITIFATSMLLGVPFIIGLALLFGYEKVFSLYGLKMSDIKDSNKYRDTYKKHG